MAFALRNPYRRRTVADGPVRDRATTADAPEAPAPSRSAVAGARVVGATSSLLLTIARLVRLVAGLVALVIVAAIVLRVLGANSSNAIVRDVHDAGRALVGPFDNLFSIKNAKLGLAVNWGIAAIVYLVVGSFVAGLVARLAPRGPVVAGV